MYHLSGDETLQRDADAWGKAVDAIAASGKLPLAPVKMLGQTPLVMNLLGANSVTGKAAAKGGIYAATHLFDGTHQNITPDMWKQIPTAMADPIAVFDSDTPKGKAKGDIVFMLELVDAAGATVVVPVALNAKGKAGTHINIAKSAYAKESGGTPWNQWFLNQAQKNARYVNRQKWERWRIGSGATSPLVASNTPGNTVYTETDLVKLREANPTMYQAAPRMAFPPDSAEPFGSLTPLNDGYLVTLCKGANLSTLFHETGHVFMEEMQKAVNLGIADDQLVADHKALTDWTARFDDDKVFAAEYNTRLKNHPLFSGTPFTSLDADRKALARETAKKEYMARGFEAYLMEGKVPTPALESAFARFRKWIKSVYIQARNLDGALTDEVRAVFDRLLVTEAEVSSSAAGMNLHGLTPDDIAALGLSGADRAHLSGLTLVIRDGAEAKMTAARDAERKTQVKEWRKEGAEKADADAIQQARKAMRAEALDIDEVRELMGDDFARALMRKNPGGLKSGGKSPVVMAAELGFDDAAAMLTSVRDAPGKTEMVNAYAEQKQAEHDAGYNVEDFVLETDAAAEQLQAIIGTNSAG